MHEDGKLITAEEAMCRIGEAAGELKEYVDAADANLSHIGEDIKEYVDSNLLKMGKALGLTDKDWDWMNGVQKDINLYIYDVNTMYFTHDTVTDHKGRSLTASYVIKPTTVYSSSQPWSIYCQAITKIESDRIVAPSSLDYIFYMCKNIADISALANWNVSKVSSMNNLFGNCQKLTDVNGLADWDTSAVTNMTQTFFNCWELSNIDGLANWNTSAVTNMTNTFSDCSEIASFAPIERWDVSKVIYHGGTFHATTGTRPSWGTNW